MTEETKNQDEVPKKVGELSMINNESREVKTLSTPFKKHLVDTQSSENLIGTPKKPEVQVPRSAQKRSDVPKGE